MPNTARRLARHDAVIVTVLAVVAALYSWWRVLPDARARLWAEDGRNFLVEALDGTSLLAIYDGYLHVVPRTLAQLIVSTVSPGSYPAAVTVLSSVVVGLVCAATYLLTRQLVDHRAVRVLIGLVPVLLPAMGVETLGNLANLHTFLFWLTPWLLLHRSRSTIAAAGWGLVALLVGGTEIVAAVFVPLAAIGWRDRRGWWIRGGLALGLAAQFAAMATHPRRPSGADDWSIADLVLGYAGQTGTGLWSTSLRLPAAVVERFGPGWLPVLLIPPLAAFGWIMVRGTSRHRLLAGVLAAASLVVWTLSTVLNFEWWMHYAAWDTAQWSDAGLLRYAAASGVFAMALVVLALDTLRTSRGRIVGAVFAGVVIVVVLLQARPDFTWRTVGEPWPSTEELRRDCVEAPSGSIAVPIAPPGWSAALPCAGIIEKAGS